MALVSENKLCECRRSTVQSRCFPVALTRASSAKVKMELKTTKILLKTSANLTFTDLEVQTSSYWQRRSGEEMEG